MSALKSCGLVIWMPESVAKPRFTANEDEGVRLSEAKPGDHQSGPKDIALYAHARFQRLPRYLAPAFWGFLPLPRERSQPEDLPGSARE
jgi:hypothetical protein